MRTGVNLPDKAKQVYCCLLLFVIVSLQTGYAFRLYRVSDNNDDAENRSVNSASGYEQVTSLLEECVRATCGDSDTYRNLCTIHCLIRMAKATDPEKEYAASEAHQNPHHKSRILPASGLSPTKGRMFARQTHDLNTCIEAKCAGLPKNDYHFCVAENCIGPFNLGIRDAEEESKAMWPHEQRKPHINKRVTEPCNCHPGVSDFPSCIRACK